MITMIHHKGKGVLRVSIDAEQLAFKNQRPAQVLLELAEAYPSELLVWCDSRFEDGLSDINWSKIIKNRLFLVSFCCSGEVFMPKEIGYVDTSAFANVNYKVPYPTWIMSGDRGAMYAETLLKLKETAIPSANFDCFLSSLAKTAMPQGLFTYSDPKLAFNNEFPQIKFSKNTDLLYDFIRNHYKKRWLLLLFVQQLVYERKFPVFSLFQAFFKIKRRPEKPDLSSIFDLKNEISNVSETLSRSEKLKFSVIIPTLGRKAFLYDVLCDLNKQSALPAEVIVIEQELETNKGSSLAYLEDETWSFKIQHLFIKQLGACHARNLGLDATAGDWVFFADDDIRIPQDFLANCTAFIKKQQPGAFTVSCLREDEPELIKNVMQWHNFGSGCSLVKAEYLKNIRFDLAFEGGYGEDADFGMQLRNKGVDILYNPFLKLTHLKAPVGGFRQSTEKAWETEEISPKPAPTVMVYQLKHASEIQRRGFKTLLFLKFFRRQQDKNPFSYLKNMQKRWESSKKWAKTLIAENQ